MDDTPDAFVEALESGDTERVNEAIDAVEQLDATEQSDVFDECFDRCLDLYEDGDGYQRQSVVRFLREGYPDLELKLAGGDASVLEAVSREEVERQRHRYVDFLLDALEDDDGRVRKAAAKGLKLLATSMKFAELDDELQTLDDQLAAMKRDLPEDKRKHVDQAHYTVGHHQGFGSPFSPS